MTTIGFPILNTDLTFAISPRQVLLNRILLFHMASIIRIIQCKFLQCREMALNAIQPRRIGRCPVKLDLVCRGILQHFCFAMERRIVQNNMQHFISRIFLPQPFQKRQKCRPVFLRCKSPDQCIPFQIIRPEHVPYAAVSIVGRPQPIHMPGSRVVSAVPRQQIQRSKLINTDTAAALGTVCIQPLNSSVFGPKLGIRGVFPCLGVPPFDLTAAQDLTQVFQRNRLYDLLGDQICTQLGQRPDAHADQLLGWREGNLADLFDDFNPELFRLSGPAIIRIPRNGINPTVVETMNDLSYPRRRTAALLGNPCPFLVLHIITAVPYSLWRTYL